MEDDKTVTLVATDLDGTLLTGKKNVNEATRQAMKELKNRGIMFGIASGRPVESTRLLVKDWGLEPDVSFLIGMNGGAIYDMRTDEKEYYHMMKGETVLDIMDHFKDMDVIFQVMVGNDRHVNKSTKKTLDHAKLFAENEMVTDFETFLPGRMVNKLILFVEPDYMAKVKERAATFSGPDYVSCQTADNLYEYMDPAINKGYGLKKICEHYGLSPDHIVAFGDAENDMEMLKFAGTGVAMKNADPHIKEVADVVTDYTNEEDGLAVYIMEDILPHNDHCLEKNANDKMG